MLHVISCSCLNLNPTAITKGKDASITKGKDASFYWPYLMIKWASLCRSVHSLEPFLRHSFLNLRWFYSVVLGLAAPQN